MKYGYWSSHTWSVPASALGIFFFGTQPAQIPLGNGWLCVSPFYPGFYRLPSVTTTTVPVPNTPPLETLCLSSRIRSASWMARLVAA